MTSRYIQTSDLNFHILEAGRPQTGTPQKPLIILLHGFPEIAYSWRRVLPKLAEAGYHAVAPDQRGFGRTAGWDTSSYEDVDLATFSLSSLVRDIVMLVHALGYRSVQCIAGHDCGAVSAAMCALMRPDFFRSVVLMSHPFNGSPELPFDTASVDADVGQSVEARRGGAGGAGGVESSAAAAGIHEALAQLGRKHYKWYYSTARAGPEMSNLGPEEMHRFLRGYFHLKSGSWAGNRPHPLGKWSAEDLVKLPGYYIMPLDETMPATVAIDMAEEPLNGLSSHSWLPDDELAVYAAEYGRTGFQGGLNWYRVRTAAGGRYTKDFEVFAGKKLEPPCAFVSGKLDWGNYQEPGAIEKMKNGVSCADLRIFRFLDGVGHWTPQEGSEEVARTIVELAGGLQ
jgi:microsomal epoxide hydrolase